MTHAAILLVGAGGHAAACIDVIEQHGAFAVAGLIGVAGEIGQTIAGYSVLATDDELGALVANCGRALVTVGQIKTPEPRIRLFDQLLRLGCGLPTIVSPRAYVSPRARLGEGTIVMHGAIVNAGASIGRNCIINSMALVEHDAFVDDHCHIATAAAVNGDVRIGAGTFVGSHSTIRQGVRIGARCVIGMSEPVLRDCEAGTTLSRSSVAP